ncbi:hypothetical protein BDV10DRAFT_159999 [Aspergillus recurvatus]
MWLSGLSGLSGWSALSLGQVDEEDGLGQRPRKGFKERRKIRAMGGGRRVNGPWGRATLSRSKVASSAVPDS